MAIAYDDGVLTAPLGTVPLGTVSTDPDTTSTDTALGDATMVGSSTDGAGAGRCPSCPHELAGHDAISARYCLATGASGSTRGCICAGSAH